SKLTYTIVNSSNQTVSSIDTSKGGTYTIKYSVSSSTGKTASNTRTVTITDLSAPTVSTNGVTEISVNASDSKAVKEEAIKNGVTFKTQNGTTLTDWSYEIYLMNQGQVVGNAISIDSLTAGQTYRVYLYCKNPNSGVTSARNEQTGYRNITVR
ncbi:MAG: hypothetical protein Q4B70_13775, partial [Lachnospiraceae bacterium]|nr:hypothetical protein [Lachnospiraceae bacterium]